MTEFCTLYVTVRDKAEAVSLSRDLIKEKLIACANISGDILSIYPWEGKICEDSERAIFMKTRKDLVEKLILRIQDLHSYDTPCIVQWDITGGSAAYLTWVGETLLTPE